MTSPYEKDAYREFLLPGECDEDPVADSDREWCIPASLSTVYIYGKRGVCEVGKIPENRRNQPIRVIYTATESSVCGGKTKYLKQEKTAIQDDLILSNVKWAKYMKTHYNTINLHMVIFMTLVTYAYTLVTVDHES